LGEVYVLKIDSGDIARVGVFSALGVVAIWIFRVPGPDGKIYFHLGETIILTSALLLGGKGGAFVGAVSSALADTLLGVPVWAPFSFVIHGAEGYIAGRFSTGRGGARDVAAMALGVCAMVAGYAASVALLYGAALVPFEILGDSLQGLLGVATSYPFARFLQSRFPNLTPGR
jgi:uncharacterized membrane protein